VEWDLKALGTAESSLPQLSPCQCRTQCSLPTPTLQHIQGRALGLNICYPTACKAACGQQKCTKKGSFCSEHLFLTTKLKVWFNSQALVLRVLGLIPSPAQIKVNSLESLPEGLIVHFGAAFTRKPLVPNNILPCIKTQWNKK
jgi:hypothetical protein